MEKRMKKVRQKGVEDCCHAIEGQSVAIVNQERTMAALYEKKDIKGKKVADYTFLCIIKKLGEKTNIDEAIEISIKEFIDTFKNYVKKEWLFITYKETKIITGDDLFQVEKSLEEINSRK